MNKISSLALGLLLLFVCSCQTKDKTHHTVTLRAPAYPLITIDPYTSVWSMTDHLYDEPVKHWTEKVQSLIGAVRVDGEVYRFLGKEEIAKKVLLPTAKDSVWEGNYTTDAPAEGWQQGSFDDSGWQTGTGAFGSSGMSGMNTLWNTEEIWVRRQFDLPALTKGKKLYLVYSHDDDFELYLNGREIVNTGNRARSNVIMELDPALLHQDSVNTIAAHCRDRGGLAYVDFGIQTDSDQEEIFSQAAVQKEVKLSATQTMYTFTCGPVNLDLTFTSPLLPFDLDILSRPINYISYAASTTDGKEHDIRIYFEITPEWAVNELNQEVEINAGKAGHVSYLRTGTTSQPVLEKSGDNVRIDWGYAYLAAGDDAGELRIGDYVKAKENFMNADSTAGNNDRVTAVPGKKMPVLTYQDDLGKDEDQKKFLMIGYDDVSSIQYFGQDLKAWWTHGGEITMDDILQKAETDYSRIMELCNDFDNTVWNDATTAGGNDYADLCILAYRQSVAAHKLTRDPEGNILFLSKENFSNGSIGTVDVTYPSAPLFLKYNPDLLKGMLNPIFYYSESGKWKKPFAAHDVGTYPKANGQTYGGDMPVEESGNMIILTAAIAKAEGNADFAKAHWEALTTWANYLLENGLDPENQLCTDDFAGHFAHNANLSVKAIMGIASYGMLAEMKGDQEVADTYSSKAKSMAKEWAKMADAGDHYRLTFDKPDTWSQKYNLVWDKLLGFHIFPEEVVKKEIPYYLTKQNQYGLPLDNRRTYTKADWIVWTATLAPDQETFEKFIQPVHAYVTHTKDRVPMSDWYETPDAAQVGFQARSVVGGYYIKMLENDL